MRTIKLFFAFAACAVMLASCSGRDDETWIFTLTVNSGGNGTAKAEIGGTEVAKAMPGATVTLTATPAAGYEFSKWTVTGDDVTLSPDANANPATFKMPKSAVSIKAEFVVEKIYSVYLAGWYQNSASNTFAYTLINGDETVLNSPAGGADALTNAMTVSGGKTYVVGSYFASSSGVARACYWVDGAVTKLDVPGRASEDEPDYAESIVVSDGKVYIAGYYFNNDNAVPCYWVDGAFTTLSLPAEAKFGVARSIAVSDGKIYVAGYHSDDAAKTPGYWLEGTFMPLDLPGGAAFQNVEMMNIVVTDKVYVMGTYTLNGKNYPCVWVDGARTELPFAESANLGATGQSMAVSGGKVYVSGYSATDNNNNRKGCYWVDGMRTDLDVPADAYSEGKSIGVIDGKVYVGGTYYAEPGAQKPCYWFRGVRTDLDLPAGGTKATIEAIHLSE